jgi:hypothetical protein
MAYKNFANGFPLPASDLQNFLMNQSVIVFADSTARGAALATPAEGMLTYLEDTNNYQYWDGAAWEDLVTAPDLSTLIPKSTVTTAGDLIVADGASSVTRLGVGADDQVLTLVSGAPAWSDAAGGSSPYVEIVGSTALPTGAGSATITGLSGYDDYLIFVQGAKSSNSSSWTFGITSSEWGVANQIASTDSGYTQTMFDGNIPIGSTSHNYEKITLAFRVQFASSGGFKPYSFNGGSEGRTASNLQRAGSGVNFSTGALDQFTITCTSGTINSGNYRVFGA